jgi:hypothetical protein
MSSTRTLQLYRQLLRQSKTFSNYNIREYALRRVRVGFRENITEQDPAKVEALLADAEQNLQIIIRQASISRMYDFTAKKLVVE